MVQVYIIELSFHIQHASGANLHFRRLAIFLYYGDIWYWYNELLLAFEPPLDMSQDIDLDKDQHPEYGQKDHIVREGINSCSCESAPLRITCSVSNRHGCVEGNNDSYQSSVPAHPNKVSPTFTTPSFFNSVHKHCVVFCWLYHCFFLLVSVNANFSFSRVAIKVGHIFCIPWAKSVLTKWLFLKFSIHLE
jgi:hypothetical protein